MTYLRILDKETRKKMSDSSTAGWILPTVVTVALLTVAALIMAAVAIVDSPIVSNGGTGGGNGQAGAAGSAGQRGAPGEPGRDGTNGTNGQDAIFQSQFMYIGYYAAQNNITGFPSPLPPPVGANLFTVDPTIVNTAAGATLPSTYGDGRIQPLICAKAGRYSFQARNVCQGTASGSSYFDFILLAPNATPTVTSKWNTIIAESFVTTTQNVIQQGWSDGVWTFSQGDRLLVSYFERDSPAGWGRANTFLSIMLISET